MKRLLVISVLVFSSSVLFAQTLNQIPCWVLASGGGMTHSANYRVYGVLGQPIVGASGSASGHSMLHGYFPCGLTATGVGDTPPQLPSGFTLHQNSPNPFNPRTVIRYEVPASGGRISLKIYDVGGRHVRTLLDRHETPGSHQVIWTGTDDGGRPVASGLYVAALETPTGRFHKKMALVR